MGERIDGGEGYGSRRGVGRQKVGFTWEIHTNYGRR